MKIKLKYNLTIPDGKAGNIIDVDDVLGKRLIAAKLAEKFKGSEKKKNKKKKKATKKKK